MGLYRMKVIIPLAGPEGEVEREFGDFKNLIQVHNKPLIKYVAEKRPYDLSKATFILLKDTDKKYKIGIKLKKTLGNSIKIFLINKLTEGAPCSVLAYLQDHKIKGDILVDLADQYLSLEKYFIGFIEKNKKKVKGIIPTFKSMYWKWSYVKCDSNGFVTQVQEKVKPPISEDATAGIYYFSNAQDFIKAAKQMINLNKRVKFNNKFFVSCVYNELPKKSVITFPTRIICPLGSVEGIRLFEQIAW